MKSNLKIFLESLGCPKNRVDSEVILSSFLEKGWKSTNNPKDADFLLLNTCSFILPAREESVSRFFDLLSIKKKNAKICVAGCLPQLYPNLFEMLPEADFITGINDNPKITELISSHWNSNLRNKIEQPK